MGSGPQAATRWWLTCLLSLLLGGVAGRALSLSGLSLRVYWLLTGAWQPQEGKREAAYPFPRALCSKDAENLLTALLSEEAECQGSTFLYLPSRTIFLTAPQPTPIIFSSKITPLSIFSTWFFCSPFWAWSMGVLFSPLLSVLCWHKSYGLGWNT